MAGKTPLNGITWCQSQKLLLKKWELGAAAATSSPAASAASAAAGEASSLPDGASSDDVCCSACNGMCRLCAGVLLKQSEQHTQALWSTKNLVVQSQLRAITSASKQRWQLRGV